MAKGDNSSELEEFTEVITIMTSQGHAARAGEVLRLALQGTPDYQMAANSLSLLTREGFYSIYPHLLAYSAQGPDCFDLAMILGYMQYSGKAGKAAQLLKDIYLEESSQGQNFKALVPCCLGSLCDSQFSDSAADLVMHLIRSGPVVLDYGMAGWCLAQHCFFGRPDWAAAILGIFRQMQGTSAMGYQEVALVESIAQFGGPEFVSQIFTCLG